MTIPAIATSEWPRDAIWLDGRWLPISGPVNYQNLALFSRKVTIGDHTKDSDDLISTWITLRDTTGGTGVLDIQEGTHDSRFWFGTLWSRDYGLLTLNRFSHEVTNGSYPLGDLKVSGTRRFFYANSTNDIFLWDQTAGTFGQGTDTLDNLTAAPVNVGVRFRGTGAGTRLFVPVGASGIDAYDGTTVTNIAADSDTNDLNCLALVEWDDKLIALGTAGELWASLDGSSFVRQASTIDGAYEPRNMVIYFNRNGDRTVHVTTDEKLHAWDSTNDVLIPTEVKMPPHPQGGLGADDWRNTLYQSAGMMVYFFNGGTQGEVGMTRNDGIPATYRGHIVDLRAEHNALYALVQGTTEDATDPDFISEGIFDEQAVFSPEQAYSSLWAYTNLGWHVVWVSDEAGDTPTRIYVSAAQGGYRLWWGANGILHNQILPRDFHNPRAALEAGVGDFATTGFIETGWFDAAMAGFRKLASHVEVGIERASPSAEVRVLYATDFNDAWLPLGDPIDEAGSHVIPFGEIATADGDTFSEGMAFGRIRFRVEMETTASPDDLTQSPVLSYLGLYFIKVPKESASWTFAVPTFSEKGFMGGEHGFESGREIKAFLDDLLEDERFIQFGYLGEIRRVKVSGVPRGTDQTGTDHDDGQRQVSLVEVKLPESRLAM